MVKSKHHKHKKSKNKTLKKLKCSPKKDKILHFSCYTPNDLHIIKTLWNSRHPDKLIKSNDSRVIWTELKDNMSCCCDTEECWLQQQFIKHNISNDILNYTFAPKAPSEWKTKPDDWLSSVDILNVMKQYEKKYPNFKFIGPSPIDYDKHLILGECVWEELCNFDIIEYVKKNTKQIGIVFNMDPHYKPGSHWVACFIDLKKQKIYYIDSNGESPHRQIKKFMKNITKQAQTLDIALDTIINRKRFQYSDSECGMFCLYFIIHLLKGNQYKKFDKTIINDKLMLKLRKKYFNQ